MGSLGDGDSPNDSSKTNPNDVFARAETQVFDSQFSPPPSPGEKVEDGNNYQLNIYDTVPVEDTFETQVVGDYETQAWSLGDETQALYLGDETQALDFFNDIENMETQLLDEFDYGVANDSDNEGSGRTEVLHDGEGIPGDDSARRGCNQSLEQEKTECTSICEQGEKDLREQRDGSNLGSRDCTLRPVFQSTPRSEPGSVRRFTSIRAASLRASGLAARSMASKEISIDSCFVQSADLSPDQDAVRNDGSEPKVVEEIDNIHDLKDNETEKGLRNGNSCRVGSSTVRKLFTEDSVSQDKGLPNNGDNAAGGENLLQFPVNDGELAGLSYVESQEPGELSQANALTFVEQFIEKNNFVDFDHQVDLGKSKGGKSKPVSTAKGPQSLAKNSNDRSKAGKTGIYDWDDSREDEGGGDLFCRRKNEFFGTGYRAQRSLTEPRQLKKRKFDLDGNGELQDVHDGITMRSDSRGTLHNIKKNEKKAEEAQLIVEKNLPSELDERLNADSSRGRQDAAVGKTDVSQILNVGPDTQLAAEAMEALLYGEGIANHDVNCLQSNSKRSAEGSSRGKSKSRVSLKQSASQKRVRLSGVGVATRRKRKSKSGTEISRCSPDTVKKFKNISEKCDRELVTLNKRRAKSMAEQNSTINGSKNTDRVSSGVIGQRNENGSLESCQPKEFNRCLRTATQNADHSMKKQKIAKASSASTPIAFRTRSSKAVIQLKTTDQILDNCIHDANHLMEVGAFEENVTCSKDVEASEVMHLKKKHSKLSSNQFGELKSTKPSQPEKLDLELTAMNNGVDGLRYPRGRRSRRNLSVQVSGCSAGMNVKVKSKDFKGSKTPNHSDGKIVVDSQPSAENAEMNSRLDKSPREQCEALESACTSPADCITPVNAASPVCMGNGYIKQSCRKNLAKSCLVKEINRLIATEPEPLSPLKDLRKRRDMASIRVLFSHHLDEDIIKQQKKILDRLGASEVSSITDATHFVTDIFVRTRNMLEAIASGKPVVTHLWLESIAQVKIQIDEESYLLRDTKKEKEFGFSMPASLARARKHPLLKDQRVLITPNIKPSKETISSLIKSVHGQAVERLGRSALKDDKLPDDLLILSCEEDYKICEPFLEKGAAVYSSELLLNGIVTQKLEYERHRLFVDNVKRTRSTIWLRKDGHKFHPVTKLR